MPNSKEEKGSASTLTSFLVAKGNSIPSQGEWTLDQGVDIPFSGHEHLLAVGPGVITQEGIEGFGPWAPVLHVTGGPLSGKTFYYGHCGPNFKHKGDQVKAGEAITQIADPTVGISSGPHIEFGQCTTNGQPLGTQTAEETKKILVHLEEGSLINPTSSTGPNGPTEVGATSAAEVEAISKGAAISAFLNLPTLEESALSLSLKGERSLMNDKPLMEFIEQLCEASLRQFQSMPNGNFYAFIPDYFGGLTRREAYWEIHDIEILDGKIELNDDALATHVYVVGDTGVINQTVDLWEKTSTAGVVTVFNAFMADFVNGVNSPVLEKSKTGKAEYEKKVSELPSLASKTKALTFLNRYGARPYYEEAPMIRSHYFEMFLAYQKFCLLWSKQFSTVFEFTFMPELIPGGLIKFPEHGLQCYIEEVSHEGDYEKGFRTRASLGAPTSLSSNAIENFHEGMIRADIFSPSVIHTSRKTKKGNHGQTPIAQRN